MTAKQANRVFLLFIKLENIKNGIEKLTHDTKRLTKDVRTSRQYLSQ